MASFLGRSSGAHLRVRHWAGLGLGLLALSAVQCSASEGDSSGDDFGDWGSGIGRGGASVIDLDNSRGGEEPAPDALNPLCGGWGTCIPDDAESCELEEPGGLGGSTGESSDAGLAGGFSLIPGEPTIEGASCRISVKETCVGSQCVERVCGPTGAGRRADPCFDSSDCGAGLLCVGDGVAGTCRPACCRGSTASCGEAEFCDTRGLTNTDIQVPVCIPVDNCSLSEPFPCPEGRSCSCTGERACVVVRDNGQTACALPGEGETGAACRGNEPGACAHGFVCSSASGCLRLCTTIGADSGCSKEETCQTPAQFPTDLGVCVKQSGEAVVAR